MPEQNQSEKSERYKRRQARLAAIREQKPKGRIRVSPRDDTIRADIKHPTAGAFRSEGSIEWPNDSFTKRRLRDGTITQEGPAEAEAREQARKRPERPTTT